MSDADSLKVDPRNRDQLRVWDGDEGAYFAAHADRFDRGVALHHRRLLAAAAIGASDRVLDVGCGTGEITRDAARAAPEGHALGVDLSAVMLDHARRRAAAEGLGNFAFEQADAQIHPFRADAFDVVISRFGCMFFADLPAAFANIGRAVRPGGRVVLLTWQARDRNEWSREWSGALAVGRRLPTPPPDAPGPFALSDPAHVRDVLTEAGFADVDLQASTGGLWVGDDVDDATDFVLGRHHRSGHAWFGRMLLDLDDGDRQRAIDGLRAALAAHAGPDGVRLDSAAWLIHAVRPSTPS